MIKPPTPVDELLRLETLRNLRGDTEYELDVETSAVAYDPDYEGHASIA